MRRLLPCLLLLLTLVPVACGSDDGGESTAQRSQTTAKTTEEPSPSALRKALKDTSTKPVIPKPSGSPPRKLVKEDIVKGKGPAAKPGDTLTVNYVGVAFSTGKEFDASWDRGQPFAVPLGAGKVIKGWDRGLVGMRKGGRRILTIPPELAYGSEGYPPAIAPNETLIFVVDAVSVKPG
jgi:peptidylprolyl isomerase